MLPVLIRHSFEHLLKGYHHGANYINNLAVNTILAEMQIDNPANTMHQLLVGQILLEGEGGSVDKRENGLRNEFEVVVRVLEIAAFCLPIEKIVLLS